jgi:purine-nucleoside phosphorylase
MALCDHIDLMFDGINQPDGVTSTPGDSPVCGRTIAGPRSPVGMYDARLLQQAARMARSGDVVCHQGVYVAMRGPNYETRAEYRFVRRIGGDAVGMSTVPEVCVASALGLRVLALSAITNVCLPDALGETTGAGVVSAAGKAADGLRRIVRGVVQAWDDRPA